MSDSHNYEEDEDEEEQEEQEEEQKFQVVDSDIYIFDYQVEPYKKGCEILQREPAYLDTSKMGLGKTVLTMAIGKTFNMILVVVCPLSMINTWEKEAKKYSMYIFKILTYDGLRGSKLNPPKHGLCKLEEDHYVPTEEFITLCTENNVLLVIDEVHKVKNSNTASLKAAHCLVKTIIEVNTGSRIALLGETPYDKPEFSSSIMKLLGIVISDRMYKYDHTFKEYELEGILEVIEKAKSYDEELTSKILEPVYFDKTSIDQLCLDLYSQVIKPHVSFAMHKEQKSFSIQKICRNGYFDMNEEETNLLREGVSMLSKATRYRPDLGTIDTSNQSFPAITKALKFIEHSKVNTSIRLARETLTENPQAKVLLFFAYVDDMKKAVTDLSEFNPLLMFGETKPIERASIEEKFQRPTDEYRLLISNPVVGGVGLNLDDRDGHWPRTMFIIPSYHFINLQQCTGRIYRPATTKSDAHIFFIYSKAFPHEVSIIDSLLRKVQTLRAVKNINDSDPLPGEYMSWFEGEGDRPDFVATKCVKIQPRKLTNPTKKVYQNFESLKPKSYFETRKK